ncbi:MAG: 2-hydroxyacid dehydrogenase, partial [Cyanobacteria bacterium PR.023]|nr:2-hydroxyacid dehydrogenase [Cyanobacteria bacterium PR.023]
GSSIFERLPELEMIAGFGVGYDHIDAAEAAKRGIIVTHTPDVLTEEVADLAIGLTIATIRQIPQADRFLKQGGWASSSFPLTSSLRGRKVGLVGFGRIGQALARRFAGFDIAVSYFNRTRKDHASEKHYDDLAAMANDVDLLISTLPGGALTQGIINLKILHALGPNGVFINVGRGTTVNEPDLIEALSRGIISAAGLDVYSDEPNVPLNLTEMSNVVLLPHVGSGTIATREAMGKLLVDNLRAWFDKRQGLTPVPESRHLLEVPSER